MTSLFGNLPSLTAQEEQPPPPPANPPPEKRLKAHDGTAVATSGREGLSEGDDQVAAALSKIKQHIGSRGKFKKASGLLRQLLQDGNVEKAHGQLVFEVLAASLRQPSHGVDPELAREYIKLFTAASKLPELFSAREQAQLDVYGIWAVHRSQIATTDDSFVFNKVLGRIKESVHHLPEAGAEEDEALLAAKARLAEEAERPVEPEKPAEPTAPAEEAEADPFGLEALIAPKPKAKKSSVLWSSREILSMKRDALLDCVDTMKACYRQAWARTSVDMAIEDIWNHRARFCASQQQRIEDFRRFVREQRAIRRQGPSSKEQRRDTTAFEAARTSWSKASVSARGAVGGGGDHGSEVWLG
ncbi:hypothetical protein WJX72_011096 [[Myrmecia] bisecta]|uniref:Uncharacterized protein n=1 Tax=[Myrmecia] bisecta TaxID=41462 RepID=A0AAW1Q837_9CHLO